MNNVINNKKITFTIFEVLTKVTVMVPAVGMWRRAFWLFATDLAEESATSVFSVEEDGGSLL